MSNLREIILFNVTGRDHSGLTAALTDVLADNGVNILDIGQAVIHDHLSLGMLLEVPAEAQSGMVLKDLLFLAHQLDLSVNFTPVADDEYEHWVQLQGKPRYIVTLLGRKLTAGNLSRVARVVSAHDLNIDGITRLSGRFSLQQENPHRRACVEFSLRGTSRDPAALRHDLLQISTEDEVDAAVEGMMALIEPVIIAFLGIVIGTIVVAMYLPMFSLISQIG